MESAGTGPDIEPREAWPEHDGDVDCPACARTRQVAWAIVQDIKARMVGEDAIPPDELTYAAVVASLMLAMEVQSGNSWTENVEHAAEFYGVVGDEHGLSMGGMH